MWFVVFYMSSFQLVTMATRMKLKLKTVFVLYFMVSLLGLVYALMQLGEWSARRAHSDLLLVLYSKWSALSPSPNTPNKSRDHASSAEVLLPATVSQWLWIVPFHQNPEYSKLPLPWSVFTPLIFCRSTLRLHRAWPAQRPYHISAAGGAAPSSGADEEVWGDQTAPQTGSQALSAHHLCRHPNIRKVAPPSPPPSCYYTSPFMHKHTFLLIFCLSRLVQKAELTRLSQTFLHVPQIHWIVVEDSPHKTPLVTDLLVKSGLSFTHLHMPTAKDRKLQEVGTVKWFVESKIPSICRITLLSSLFLNLLLRGIPAGWSPVESSRGMRVYGGSERTEGLSQVETPSRGWFTSRMTTTHTACRYLKRWMLQICLTYCTYKVSSCGRHACVKPSKTPLVLSQMRSTQRVSVWPVGLVGGMKYERPVIEGGKVSALLALVCQWWNRRNCSRIEKPVSLLHLRNAWFIFA